MGRSQDELELTGERRLADVFDHYVTLVPALGGLSRSILLSRNEEFASRDEIVHDGDEIAFLPPVSGGMRPAYTHEIVDAETGNFFALTNGEIDSKSIVNRLLRPEDGAYVDFVGVVRYNTKG